MTMLASTLKTINSLAESFTTYSHNLVTLHNNNKQTQKYKYDSSKPLSEEIARAEGCLKALQDEKDKVNETMDIYHELCRLLNSGNELETEGKIIKDIDVELIKEMCVLRKALMKMYEMRRDSKKKEEEERHPKQLQQIETEYSESCEKLLHITTHRVHDEMTINEFKQFEEWTEMKVADVVFDTEYDDWSVGSNVFDEKVVGREKLVFLVKDTEGNKFGYYLDTKVQPGLDTKWVPTNHKSFMFSLHCIHRNSGMLKFEVIYTPYGYFRGRDNQFRNNLFYAGYDFWIERYGTGPSGTRHDGSKTNFHGVTNPLTGKTGSFNVKRFVVIQMK